MQNDWNYLIDKRKEILEEIKPYCELFGITNYDYFVNTNTGGEVLNLNNTYIGCTGNSTLAVIDEFIGYIIITRYCKNRSLGAFRTQTMNEIRSFWIERPQWIDNLTEQEAREALKGGGKE